MAAHLTGVDVEGVYNTEDTWNYTLALGAGPALEKNMEPFDIFSFRGDSHKLSGTARLSYSPGTNNLNELGGFVSHSQFTGNGDPASGAQQTASGFFGNWKWRNTRLIGELFFISNRVDFYTHSDRGSFTNAYLQSEYDWTSTWTLYARCETTRGNKDDAYLTLFPEFVSRRNLAGVRYDFAPRQAVTVEMNRSYRLHDAFNQLTLQWSAGFP